ncbi:MAG TPA: PilZ domain-containing protein [Chloroflexota bacterium]|jgi:hypothetical protein|nr:PilZ domain-containing protein [Chloroflexota bacterium]
MTPAAANRHVETDDAALPHALPAVLIPQPAALRLPVRVPVLADTGGTVLRAEVLGSSAGVLLLQGLDSGAPLPALGTTIKLRSEWDRQFIHGRIAAHGVAGRFLVSLGERAIRRSRRVPVDLAGLARSAVLGGSIEVRVTDLSAGGARVAGITLPIGSEVGLQFTPPGQAELLSVSGFVVRIIDATDVPTVGVAFRLVQQSMDMLSRA